MKRRFNKNNSTNSAVTVDRQTTGINHKAALVLLTAGQWTAHKLDREATSNVISGAGASPESGRFNKSLLPGDSLIREIAKNINDFRQGYHYKVTLPWGDDGWRLIPAKRITEYRNKFRASEDKHNALVAKLVYEYERKKDAAKVSLNTLYRESDYPQGSEIAGKYRLALDWTAIADSQDFRIQISEESAREIRAEIETATQKKLTGAVKDTYERVHNAVTNVVTRLSPDESGDERIFRDSLIGNLKELADILPTLNITGDPTLAKVSDKIATKLARLDPGLLRESDARRTEAVKDAQEILAEIAGAF